MVKMKAICIYIETICIYIKTYFSEKIDLKSSRFIGLGLAVIQIIPHSQHKLGKKIRKLIYML